MNTISWLYCQLVATIFIFLKNPQNIMSVLWGCQLVEGHAEHCGKISFGIYKTYPLTSGNTVAAQWVYMDLSPLRRGHRSKAVWSCSVLPWEQDMDPSTSARSQSHLQLSVSPPTVLRDQPAQVTGLQGSWQHGEAGTTPCTVPSSMGVADMLNGMFVIQLG